MTIIDPSQFSDRELLDAAIRAVDLERGSTAHLLGLLAEVDARKLYLGEGFSSLFSYCTRVLRLSEPAAYSRITAARAIRRLPAILRLLRDGSVSLTTVSLLSTHLTEENHHLVLESARHKSKREIELLIAHLEPKPDVPSTVRKLPLKLAEPAAIPAGAQAASALPRVRSVGAPAEVSSGSPSTTARHSAPSDTQPKRAVIAPLAPERYLLKMTIGRETHDKLQRARDLLRHVIPSGDPVAVFDRALDLLIEHLEKSRLAAVSKPRLGTTRTSAGRHVPSAVKRAVWKRDGAKCAFIGDHGRCEETGFLEFHHVVQFADGGSMTVENLELRCRAHNAFEAHVHVARQDALFDGWSDNVTE